MPRGATSEPGFNVYLDPKQLRDTLRALKEIEGGRALQRELRKNLRSAAGPIVRDAKQEASWSTRIPGAISARVWASNRRTGIFITVNRTKAPHGRPFEGLSRSGNRDWFRHRVFGRDVWVTQKTRPFLAPARDRGRREVERAAAQALAAMRERLGW